MRHPIRAVMIVNAFILAINIAGTCKLNVQANEEKVEVQSICSTLCMTTTESSLAVLEDAIMNASVNECNETIEVFSDEEDSAVIACGIVMEEPIVIESVSMRGAHGGRIETDPVEVSVVRLAALSQQEYEIPEWDIKERMATIQVLWDFLVNQQGISPMNASAIIGSICCEGDFGQQQGTKNCISSISEARQVLGSGEEGYGLVQWTYGSRQATLLKYYEMANEQYPDNFEQARMVAECCMLLEELKAYEIFEDIYTDTTIEDALGRLSREYFKYENYWEDWTKDYTLKRDYGSGKSRLNYATSIYEYFTDMI